MTMNTLGNNEETKERIDEERSLVEEKQALYHNPLGM